MMHYTLGMGNAAVQHKTETVHFGYSEELLDLRLSHALTMRDTAALLDMSTDMYSRLEFCDLTVPLRVYADALYRLELILKERKES